MKDFILKVLNNREFFQYITLSYRDLNNIQKVVLQCLNLNNINDLRDKHEGVAFIEKFSLRVFGVIAIQNLLKLELIDLYKINPKTYQPNITLLNQEINVIMSEYGEFPIIDKLNDKPAIITIKKGTKEVWICGYADIDTLNSYQDDTLIKGSMTKNIDSKTVFIGFEYLKPFKSLEDLKKLI